MRISLSSAISLLLCLTSYASAHTVLTYPGWRGDNLNTNGSINDTFGLGVGPDNTYPYGMQWIYPCGGMPMTTNRTKWPVKGGAVGLQPGWFQGHSSALIYINIGDGTIPQNYSLIANPVFGIQGPDNVKYNGSVCIPQVPLPANYTPSVGQNATIQVVEAAQHGAALYSCVDITYANPEDCLEVTPDNCSNSSDIVIDYQYATSNITSAATRAHGARSGWLWLTTMPLAAAVGVAMFL